MGQDEQPSLVSLEDIDDDMTREKLEDILKAPYVLGVMVWGSRATGFGAPDTDWDILIYVTDEYYQSLELKDTLLLEFDESVEPKRLVNDFSPISDSWFKQQIESPHDIDHSPYVEGIVIYDPSGELEEWRQKLARYPEEEHVERLKSKLVVMRDSLGTARQTDSRGQTLESKISLYRSIVAAVHLWYSMKKSWSPPLKWWTKWVKRLGMTDETFEKFSSAIEEPTLDHVMELYKHLHKLLIADGHEWANDFLTTFLEIIHPDGRPKFIRHSYL